MELPEMLTVDEVAAFLRIHKDTVLKYIREGALPALRLGKAYRIRRVDLEQFIEDAIKN